jgi:DNA gyrase subunit A
MADLTNPQDIQDINNQNDSIINNSNLIDSDLESRVEIRMIENEMRTSYLKYAMSVIVSRALPDVRDGLKPVHRRIIHVMNKMGLTPGSKYRKSAQVVGEVLGKYHPHGDIAVYDSLVRMAQDFSLRYPLVDGQGNFGSIDGDSAAAHRYTEARMARTATFLIQDIEKDTVDFVDNYDGSYKEPTVLPSRIPNLLINGVSGIAVGMATNIPPHNLSEVCQALIYLQQNPEATIEDLANIIKGPDLPTGGTIYGAQDLLTAYQTGRGKCAVRAKAVLTDDTIIITEIPYQVNKSATIEKIAELIKEKRLEGIRDLRDESNKEGIRIVIECKRDTSPEIILNHLYSLTDLQTNINFNLVALVDGGRQPKLLNLKEILVEFLNFRKEVVTRRTQFELKQAENELHILDALKKALDFIDEVIKLIRSSYDKEEAAKKLMDRFEFTAIQVDAILQMRLQTLTNLDKNKIEDKRQNLLTLIDSLKEILENPAVKAALIAQEINEASEKLSSPRRTLIISHPIGNYNKEDYIEDEEVLVQLTNEQYLKVLPLDTFKQQGRGGKGVNSFNAKEEDWIKSSKVANSHDFVYAFTNSGRVFRTRVFDLPSGSRTGRGQNLINFFELKGNEKISTILTLTKDQEEAKEGCLIFATKCGVVKKTSMEEFSSINRSGKIAINLDDEDNLIEVGYSSSHEENIILSASNGKTLIFSCEKLNTLGRSARGVRGIKIDKKDKLISLQISPFNFEEGGEE